MQVSHQIFFRTVEGIFYRSIFIFFISFHIKLSSNNESLVNFRSKLLVLPESFLNSLAIYYMHLYDKVVVSIDRVLLLVAFQLLTSVLDQRETSCVI